MHLVIQSGSTSPAMPAPPEALVRETWVLEPPAPCERPHVERNDAGLLVDGLLARVARGRGALDVAVGEGLEALASGDRALQLGYSCIGDYARERLGIGETTARNMVNLARELRDRPLLRGAVRRGEVSARKAQAVLPLARGEDEAAWIERAQRETVRALEAAVRLARGPSEEEEEWDRIAVEMKPEDRAKLEEAMGLAGRLLGAAAPKWQRLEAICQEFLGAHPEDEGEEDRGGVVSERVDDWLEQAKEGLEREMNRWDFLEAVAPVEAPVAEGGGTAAESADPRQIDARLRELAAMRDRWDALLGHLAMLMKNVGLWRDAGFASFNHYCVERLGMATRTVEQRAALARRLHALPGLREAMEAGRVSYEKARIVARVADDATVEAWIRRAETSTCIELRREIDASDDTQMCARGELTLRVPRQVRVVVDAAVRAARKAEGRWIGAGECLGRVAQHFIETWTEAVPRRRTPQQRVIDRDGGFCRVPGCSRPAAHAHHIVYRSAGGEDDPSNLVALCAAHHLHGVHLGWVRVRGRAPERLAWLLPSPPLGFRA